MKYVRIHIEASEGLPRAEALVALPIVGRDHVHLVLNPDEDVPLPAVGRVTHDGDRIVVWVDGSEVREPKESDPDELADLRIAKQLFPFAPVAKDIDGRWGSRPA